MNTGNSARWTQSILKGSAALVLLGIILVARAGNKGWLKRLEPLGVNPDTFCLFDYSHYYLAGENRAIMTSKWIAYPLQIVSSFMIDGTFIYTLICWILEATTARLLYSMIFFYGLRALVQVGDDLN